MNRNNEHVYVIADSGKKYQKYLCAGNIWSDSWLDALWFTYMNPELLDGTKGHYVKRYLDNDKQKTIL